jgi:hypothetical protein
VRPATSSKKDLAETVYESLSPLFRTRVLHLEIARKVILFVESGLATAHTFLPRSSADVRGRNGQIKPTGFVG